MNDVDFQIYSMLHQSIEKRIYFLLASAGASIGFAITQTETIALEWPNYFVLVAMGLWAVSFLSGLSALKQRELMFETNRFMHTAVDEFGESVENVRLGLKPEVDKISSKLKRRSREQFLYLTLGAISMIGWKIAGAY